MGFHLQELVKENLHELYALEDLLNVESLWEEHRLSPHVCGLDSDPCTTENGHNHNHHHHNHCDSLLSHNILVCIPYLGLGLGKNQIYLGYDFDTAAAAAAAVAKYLLREAIDRFLLGQNRHLHLGYNAASLSVSDHLDSCNVQLLGVRLYHVSEAVRLSTGASKQRHHRLCYDFFFLNKRKSYSH